MRALATAVESCFGMGAGNRKERSEEDDMSDGAKVTLLIDIPLRSLTV
jgi:hypothetical protein